MPVILVLLVISIALSYALRPRVPQPPAATLADVSIPQIEIGKPISVAFGEVWIDDSNIVWFGDLSNQAVHSTGGKKG